MREIEMLKQKLNLKNKIIARASVNPNFLKNSPLNSRPTLFGLPINETQLLAPDCGFGLLCGMGGESLHDRERTTISSFMHRETILKGLNGEHPTP